MKLTTARVMSVETLGAGTTLLWLMAPETARAARPGQFVMVRCGEGVEPFLPRPFSVTSVRTPAIGQDEFALLIGAAGKSSAWLSTRRPGDEIILVGPLGRPVEVRPSAHNLLLIAEGTHVAPLLFLVERLARREYGLTLIFAPHPQLELSLVPLLPPEVELIPLVASDQAVEALGVLQEHLLWVEQLVVAGEEPLLRNCAAALRSHGFRKPATALVRTPLACGTGLGGCCPIETRRRGYRLACVDGPAFDLLELY